MAALRRLRIYAYHRNGTLRKFKVSILNFKFRIISRLVAINDGKVSNSSGTTLEDTRVQGFKESKTTLDCSRMRYISYDSACEWDTQML